MRTVSRRTFLGSVVATGATLTLAFAIPALVHRRRWMDFGRRAGEFAPNLWIRIDAAGDVYIRVHKCEMGQGVLTTLAMLIADELEADWSRVRVEQADADFRFADQNTAGSSSIIDTWVPLRRAGAAGRLVLVRAAARSWEVPEGECSAREGRVIHQPTGRGLSFGELVPLAEEVPPPRPEEIRLKPPEGWRLIGKPVGSVDVSAKVTGRQVYGLDVRVAGMLYATVARCPVIGGSPLSIDDRAARAVPGVRGTFALAAVPESRLPARVAVVGDSTWAALEGRRRLRVEWAEGPNAALSSETIAGLLRGAGTAPPIVARNDGDAIGAGALGLEAVHATYEVPYLAHAPMEPMNCTADAGADAIEIWAPTQFPQRAVEHVSALTGFPPLAVRLHVVPMGGGFGRRAYPDFVVEAVQVSRAAGAPVQTVWTREDDMRQDYFRPAGVQRLSAVIDARGRPAAWVHRLAGPSVNRHVFGKTRPVEENEIDGAATLPYSIPHVRVEYRPVDVPVPLGVWRSVAQSQNVFAVESFVDELAHRAGADPVEYRRRLLGGRPRLLRVLELAAEAARWGEPLPRGWGRGVAINQAGATFVAQVAEASVDATGRIRVHRITCVVDCGRAVNPLLLEAQIEGAIAWGLSAALYGKITVRNGRIEQSNFHDYRLLRLPEMPAVAIRIVPSSAEPSGIGEPPVPPVAPAVANAVFAATGVRHRVLPLVNRRAG